MDKNGHFWWRSAKNHKLCFSGKTRLGEEPSVPNTSIKQPKFLIMDHPCWSLSTQDAPPESHTFTFRVLRASNQHSSDRERQNEGRFTPILNNSQEKGLRIFNKPSFYEARLTFFLDSVEYYKLSGVHLRTFYLEQRHGLSTFYII